MSDCADQWGVGNRRDEMAFDTTWLGDEPIELLWGEHPHARQDNNVYARTKSGAIYDFSGHRCLIDIEIRSRNYLKTSGLSGDEIRKSVRGVILSDGEAVYEVGGRDVEYVLLQVHHILGVLKEHSSDFLNKAARESMVGRQVYYDRTPAVIERVIADQGCVILKTDNGSPFPGPIWADDDDDPEFEASIKTDVLDPKIWWFRDRSQP